MAVRADRRCDVHPIQELSSHEVAQDIGVVGQDNVRGGGEGVLRKACFWSHFGRVLRYKGRSDIGMLEKRQHSFTFAP